MTSPNPTGLCLCGCGRTTPIATRNNTADGLVKGEHKKFCDKGCSNRFRSGFSTTEERFWAKVDKSGDCWIWLGGKNARGYGTFHCYQEDGKRHQYAHRVAYELANAPIPPGLVIDHLCRNPSCVNPEHLEVVSQRVNMLRGVAPAAITVRTNTCRRGHELTPENTYVRPNGYRWCRECCRIRDRRRAAAA